ncbi:MAG: metallophosphoesterase [Halodesulfurarchaeum sp.]
MQFPNATVDDRAIYFPSFDALVLADLHLGRVRSSQVELPLGEHADILERIEAVCHAHEPTQVVLAGDVVHAFDSIPVEVAETITTLAETIAESGASLTVTAGNHDPVLASLDVVDPVPARRLGPETVVLHGHEEPPVDVARYVIGHEHPAITIEGMRRPCYLDCPDQRGGAAVLVLPAFSRAAPGTTVNAARTADTMSPLLTDLDRCRPIVPTDGDPLEFPALEEFRPHL